MPRADQSGDSVRVGNSISFSTSKDADVASVPAPAGYLRDDEATLPAKREKLQMPSTVQPQPSSVVYKRQEINDQTLPSSRVKTVRYSLIGTCIVLLVGLVVLFTTPFLRTRAQVNALPSPTLTTMNATSVFPSGSITLHGANFTPGATVSFSSDGFNLALAYAYPSVSPANPALLSALDNLALSAHQARSQDRDARVQYDGTFDLALAVPPSWQAGSVHKIEAKESGSSRTAFVNVKVLAKGYAISPPASQATLWLNAPG
jgi:hypothetical protein